MTSESRPSAGQEWNAEGYARHAGFVPELGAAVLELLAPRPGEAILDLGCGDGVLTARIREAGARVTRLEPDPDMAARARARGNRVLEQDAHDPFGSGLCDAVFSNAALHWMRDPPRVLRNIHAALKPGGRLVAEQGGFGNVAAVVTALTASLEAAGHPVPPSPWDFPTPTAQRARLEAAGFRVETIALIQRPTPLPTGLKGWLATFGAPFMPDLDTASRQSVVADTERRLAHLRDETGTWYADYVRLRFRAFAA